MPFPRTRTIVAVAISLAALTVASLSHAPSSSADSTAPTLPLHSPVVPISVATLAHLPVQPWLPGHRGIDLAAAQGDTVYSPGPGTITFSGFVVDRPVLTVTLDNGLRSSVEPVSGDLEVGTRVARGDAIGTVADAPSHCRPDTCVHWGLRDGDRYLDPLDYLDGFGPIRLLAGASDRRPSGQSEARTRPS
ncbi:M23 family metallopeptidase [Demequina sp. B12]|uniref:M23 family metallopeptidase n=1 Tax=Demequina sp. B12 TaxID=2992757 RepID=UPI00237AA5EE|nr:peptidoglycan DD-metalloendopeptidase family protein [Demequina sp. B12]MDE0573408.1 M23 family metallopeptidase [Demequina sp. B12]